MADQIKAAPFGYAVEQPDGHVTFFKDDPKGFRAYPNCSPDKSWAELGVKVHDLFTQAAAPAVPAVDALTRYDPSTAFPGEMNCDDMTGEWFKRSEVLALLATLSTVPDELDQQQVADMMLQAGLVTELGYSALRCGDLLEAPLEYLTRFANVVRASNHVLPPVAAPVSRHGASVSGTISAGEYFPATDLLYITIKVAGSDVPEALRTIGSPVELVSAEKSQAPGAARGRHACNKEASDLAHPADAGAVAVEQANPKLIETLKFALQDALGFAELIELMSKPDVEVYKHELRGDSERAQQRINVALQAIEDAEASQPQATPLEATSEQDEPTDREALIACLGDDAAQLDSMELWPEMAQTMREAAAMLEATSERKPLPPLPELDCLADIAYAQKADGDGEGKWDADYRHTCQKLQVAQRNKMQWRTYALQLRDLLKQHHSIPGGGK